MNNVPETIHNYSDEACSPFIYRSTETKDAMNRTRRGFVIAAAATSVAGVVSGDDETFCPEISIGRDYLSAWVESDFDPEYISIETADGTVHEFTENTGRFEGGYTWVNNEHHIGDGWYGIIERVEARRDDRVVFVTNEQETSLDVGCSLWKTPESGPVDFRMTYEHAWKMYDPPAGDEPVYGSPGRVLQSVEDVSSELRIEFDNRQECEPEGDTAVEFDCTSVTVTPEEFVNGAEEIYQPRLTFADETAERVGDRDELFEPPVTFEGTGGNEGNVIRSLHFRNDQGGDANFTYLNPDVDDCEPDEAEAGNEGDEESDDDGTQGDDNAGGTDGGQTETEADRDDNEADEHAGSDERQSQDGSDEKADVENEKEGESEAPVEDENETTPDEDENPEETESENSSTEIGESSERDDIQNETSDEAEPTSVVGSTSVDTPGMGVSSGLAALGGAVYLSVRQLRAAVDDTDEQDQ